MENMIEKRTWKEFQDAGLLWWVNRGLHLFGWSIIFIQNENNEITEVYPARVKFRGFNEDSEERGYQRLTNCMNETMPELLKEVEDESAKD